MSDPVAPLESGRVLTLIGADGAGKSTQARRLCARLGARAVHIYMGSNPTEVTHALPSTRAWVWLKRALGRSVHHSGPPDPEPASRPSRRRERALQHGKSLAAVGLRVSEELYRLLRAQSYARKGYVVILDRHPYADYFARRVRATDAWVRWGDRIHGLFLERVYPRPQGLVLLDAPAEVLHARKPEGSLAAVRARRQEYLDMARALPSGMLAVVDVSRPEEDVLTDLLRIAGGSASLDR